MHSPGVFLPCPGPCGNHIPRGGICCASCWLVVPEDLVVLVGTTAGTVPVVYETAVKCVGMWLRTKHPRLIAS